MNRRCVGADCAPFLQGYGTALGVITYLFDVGKLNKAYFTQSTPYHQGSRLVPDFIRRDASD